MSTYTPTAHEPGCGCKQCEAGQRNRFFKGKLMKAPEFAMEQRYGIERRRMLTRELAGWGVVRGLALHGSRHGAAEEFRVSRGLAIDCQGREILLCEDAVIGAGNTFVVGENCELKSVEKLEPGQYVLAIHYAELLFGDASLPDACCTTKTEKSYVCETALFSLRPLCEECPCGEPDCPKHCRCGHGERCCGESGRGSHLCCWSAQAEGPCESSKPCHERGYDVFINDGVDLACVCVREPAGRCHPPKGHIEDDCGPRRIVKSNDLLYDLIRGCDLTRIECLSWGEWHRSPHPVPWEEFLNKLGAEVPSHHHGARRTGFAVEFSGPVKSETVRPDCFTFAFTTGHAWRETLSAEIVEVILSGREEHDPPETARVATLCVSNDWMQELTCHGSRVRREGAEVWIEVRGDFILDCQGQAVDANARGFALRGPRCEEVRPSGNGTPGGTLVSVFRVERQAEIR